MSVLALVIPSLALVVSCVALRLAWPRNGYVDRLAPDTATTERAASPPPREALWSGFDPRIAIAFEDLSSAEQAAVERLRAGGEPDEAHRLERVLRERR